MTAVDDARRYHARERLNDDSTLLIRAIHKDDADALREGFEKLSAQSVHQRFFENRKQLSDAEVAFYTHLDFDRHVGLAGLIDSDNGPVPVATARYVRFDEPGPSRAEMAFVVVDAHQGLGIGSHMFRHLAGIARRRRIERFVADMLPDNNAMLAVLRHSGCPVIKTRKDDVLHVEVLLGEGTGGPVDD